ncbi:MAG: SseB family protein [Microbacterium sp.]
MPSDAAQKNLVRNERVQEALATWSRRKDAATHSDVLRRAASGHLLLDITHSEFADPDRPMQEGDRLVVTSVTDDSGKDLLLAFTDNARLESYVSAPSGRSLAQPAAAALAQAAEHHDGIAIDAGTDGAFIAYSDEIERAFGDGLPDAARLATATVEEGLEAAEFLALLRDASVYVGGVPVEGDDGTVTGYRVVTAARQDGGTLHALFTSPAELWAWRPGTVAQRTTIDRVVEAAREDGMAGIVVNPLGPSVELELDGFDTQ